ncbi:MAG: TlpA family protein disulfide reductase [Planctomycetaceae bacterium]
MVAPCAARVCLALLAGVLPGLLPGRLAPRVAADEPSRAPAGRAGVVELRDGSLLRGDFAPSADTGHLLWQSASFDSPFRLRLPAVNAVHFPVPAPAETADVSAPGTWRVELQGGGALWGELLSIDDQSVRLQVAGNAEPLVINRPLVERIARPQADLGLVFSGPRGLDGWTQTEPPGKPAFRDEAGQLVAHGEAILESNFPVPGQVACELELSWRGEPAFTFELGCELKTPQRRGGLRIEAVQNTLVAVRELAGDADLVPLQSLEPGSGRLQLKLLMSQDPPRMQVYSMAGQQLANLQVTGKVDGPWGVRLINRFGGNTRLERLRITGWDGSPPREVESAKTRVHRTTGEIVYGAIDSLRDGQLTVTVDGTANTLPLTELATLVLSASRGEVAEGISVGTLNGSRLTGSLLGVSERDLTLAIAGISPAVRIPRAELRTLLVPDSLKGEEPAAVGRLGTLQLTDQFVRGWLVETSGAAEGGVLRFQPAGSDSSARLKQTESGRLVYAEPPPPAPRTEQERRVRRLGGVRVVPAPGVGAAALDALQALAGRFAAPKGPPAKPQLHLRTGDTITCETAGVDEQGVALTSTSIEARHVPHDRVKLLELVPGKPEDVKLAKARKERLLTLPRMQRPNPPTQLVRSTSGDFLRGRVTSLDKSTLKLEVRLDNREISRELVSHIFWLHPDELDAKAATQADDVTNPVQRVQAHRHDGFRLTFVPREFREGVLTGDSDVLGVCRAEIEKIDELIIGGGIEQAVAQLAYHRWRLRNAPDPKFVTDDGGSDGGTGGGEESPLVGKPAPDFKLALLTGGDFQLAAQKGKITVLDFFATWCGPCVKAMPLVEQAVHSFPPDKVQLVAVNLQEQPKQIEALLNRHQLDVTVVLDVDGVVAEKYQASAIPQTVIVDAEGKIVRLYVGGGPDLGEQIKQAVQELLEPAPQQPTGTQ